MNAILCKYVFLTFLYFVEGLPFGINSYFLPVYLHSKAKKSATSISLLKLANAPWLLKFLWGPMVDGWGSKRMWVVITNIFLTIIAIFCSQVDSAQDLLMFSIFIFILNLVTSVQDVAIDATTFSILDSDKLAMANVVGYKLGSLFTGGLLLSHVDSIGWMNIFFIIAICYFTNKLESRKIINENSTRKPRENFYDKFDFIFNRNTFWMVIFLLCYKLGHQGSFSILPLFLLDSGIDKENVILWLNIYGQILSIAGSLLGGLLIQCRKLVAIIIIIITDDFVFINDTRNVISLESLLWNLMMTRFLFGALQTLFIILWLNGFITTCTFTLMMLESQSIKFQHQATYHAIISTAEVLGKLVFASFCGLIVDTCGYSFAFVIFALLNALAMPVLCRTRINRAVKDE
ncbi:hypothetical protein HELRODRAFT_90722 [Helobdella robusta]|uniref:Major facilitator superfamily domain-containing protein 3 n=1 Tax=Helobdella robusta TaxID=6412 RepID=T1G7V0_HELRO|nr:hypothetical protein HELRODRAFT_90722 [Helobdella robusta]ESN90845.1 hypothetical protein HELRODRAFT_90722 [Helobdella robusta]